MEQQDDGPSVVMKSTRFSREVDEEEEKKKQPVGRQSSSCSNNVRKSELTEDSSPRSTYWTYARSGNLDHQSSSLGDMTPGKTPKPSRYVNDDERDGERTPGVPLFKTPRTSKKGRYLRTNSDAEHKALVSGDRTPGPYLESCSFEDFFVTPKSQNSTPNNYRKPFFADNDQNYSADDSKISPKQPDLPSKKKSFPFICCRSTANDIIVSRSSPVASHKQQGKKNPLPINGDATQAITRPKTITVT